MMLRQGRLFWTVLAPYSGLGTSLIRYPLTWLALALIGLTHGGFSWWFHPSVAMQWLALGIDGVGVWLWGRDLSRSAAFHTWQTHRLYDAARRQAQRLLPACPAAFAQPAQQCLALIQQIYQEFTETASRQELDTLMQNIGQLARAHLTLHLRAQRFGTPEQKTTMTTVLQHHITSITNTLTTLQTFSGNLTLLSASVDADQSALQQLHFLNQGLQAVLQEFHDAYT